MMYHPPSDATILDEELDASYEPSGDEVQRYAEWLGMKSPEDEGYYWIALRGLKVRFVAAAAAAAAVVACASLTIGTVHSRLVLFF
jgi:hypothetical protein